MAITDTLVRMLRLWWATHRHPRLLYPNPGGCPERMLQAATAMVRGRMHAAIIAAVAEARIGLHLSVHSLGHGFSTHMLKLGVDVREVQTIVGHAHSETNARCAHLTEGIAAQARESQGRLLESFVLRCRYAA